MTSKTAPGAAAQDNTSGENFPGGDADSTDLGTGQGTDTPESRPAAEATPPPALDAGAVTVGPELANESLDPEINRAIAPALAASLRLTESARKRLGDGQVDDATVAALERLLASGRKLVLVTGRELPELLTIFPHADLFERIVADEVDFLSRHLRERHSEPTA